MSGQHVILEASLAKTLCFFIFKVSFLKDVSRKSFVFELQSFIFEGNLAEMLRFELQSFIFEGSLAQKLRF